jgi:iron complex outermembrane receptor protein
MPAPLTRKNLPLAVLLASGLSSGHAAAQLEEVIVTAQKRAESLQDIPVSIYAYDSQAIESMRLNDATVGLYYDGVYAARSSGLLADLSELERVEILRGPQGTL